LIKLTFMYNITTIIGVLITIYILWMLYAVWSAPLMKENEDGSWTTMRPERKFRDLFKQKNKK
jgi:hypothetical protein